MTMCQAMAWSEVSLLALVIWSGVNTNTGDKDEEEMYFPERVLNLNARLSIPTQMHRTKCTVSVSAYLQLLA